MVQAQACKAGGNPEAGRQNQAARHPKELKYLAQRAAVAELLIQGVTYDAIIERLRTEDGTVSTATVNRVSEIIKKDENCCLGMMLQRASGAEDF